MAALRALYNRPLPSLPVPMTYSDLSPSEIASLTRILVYLPPPTLPSDTSQRHVYNRTTSTRIAELPSHLRSHPSLVARALNRLCNFHKELLPGLLSDVLRWIKHEIEKKITRVLVPLLEAGALSEEQRRVFAALKAVTAMWTPATEYETRYGVPVVEKWAQQENGCAACMLSRIGGEKEVLLALRAGMVARMRGSKAEGSKRLMWMEGWMKNCNVGGEELVWASDRLGKEVKEVWRKWKKAKKRRVNEGIMEASPTGLSIEQDERRNAQQNDVGDGSGRLWEALAAYDAEHGEDSEDFEDEIIRSYRNTMFGLSLPADSVSADLGFEKSHNIRPSSESYSDRSEDFATESVDGHMYHDADALAEEYRSLLDGSAFDSDEDDVPHRHQRSVQPRSWI